MTQVSQYQIKTLIHTICFCSYNATFVVNFLYLLQSTASALRSCKSEKNATIIVAG